ncbi:MAG TPA: hypothetical protein VF463_00915 [Sphingobium sp.]
MKRTRICVVGLAAVIASGKAYAQAHNAPLGTTPQIDTGQLREDLSFGIIVTAQKRSASLNSVLMSFTAIGANAAASRPCRI